MCRSARTCFRAPLSANRCSGRQATDYSAWAYSIPISSPPPRFVLRGPLLKVLPDDPMVGVLALRSVDREWRQTFPFMARTGPPAISVLWSLPGVKQTLRGKPIPVAIDPERPQHLSPGDQAAAAKTQDRLARGVAQRHQRFSASRVRWAQL